MFESVVMHSLEPIIAIDNAYNIMILNHAIKINSKSFFGKELREGINLKDALSQKTHLLNAWTTVIKTGQPSTAKYDHDTVDFSCYPLIGSNNERIGAYGFLRNNVSSQHAVEMEGENGFQMIAENLPHGVFLSHPNGEVYYSNRRWCEYTGIPEDKTHGTQWSVAIHPEDISKLLQAWNGSVRDGKRCEARYRIKTADSTYRWNVGRAEPITDSKGKIVRWIGTVTDVEDFVQIECQLSNATEQLNLLMAAAHFGVWNWDLTSDKVAADTNTFELLDLNPENFDGSVETAMSHIYEADMPSTIAELKRALEEHDIYDQEVRIKKTGRIVAGRGKFFWNDQGDPVKMTGICWDITQKKKLEHERMKALEFAEEQARQRVKQAELHQKRIEEFVDTICHEIRNPLNGITGIISQMQTLLEPLMNGKMEMKQVIDAFQQMREGFVTLELCAEQQQVIVNDVLDLSKVEHNKLDLNPTLFNPTQVLQTVRGVFTGALKQKNLAFKAHYGDGVDSTFQADSHRLTQILINLISNSIKFTDTGTVSVSVSKEVISTQSSDFHSNCFLHFLVEDTGIGMTSEEVERLFKKFGQANSTISPRYGGSGLGLVISKKLIQRMGGVLHVDTEKGRGTRFEFSIQCKQTTESQNKESEKNQEQPNLSGVSVLIVEDNVINQKILASYLKQVNCSFQVANNGVEALEQCCQAKFDVIFMDLEMPIMGGLEATRRIRDRASLNHQTPIIGLSGNARKEHKEEAIRCGMNQYLTKPYHKTEIYGAMMQVLESKDEPVSLKRKRL